MALDDYLKCFETLRPDTINALANCVAEEIRFSDPFSDVRGRAAFTKIFEHMFKNLPDARFVILDRAVGQSPGIGYIKWRMDFTMGGAARSITGMSEIHIAPNGKIAAHIDHWDSFSQLLCVLPWGLGGIFRSVRRLFSF